MNEEMIEALAEAVARKQARWNAPVLNLNEAMAYVGKRSERSFRRWCKDYKVRQCSSARWSRRALEMGMNAESRGRGRAA